MKYLYTASIYCNINEEKVKISKDKEQYTETIDDDCVVDQYHFVSKTYSTKHLGDYLDMEFQVTDDLVVFYSKSEDKVNEFIDNWIKVFEVTATKMCNTLASLEGNYARTMGNCVEFGNRIAFHPGYYIKEIIEDSEVSYEYFAEQLDITTDELRRIVSGKQKLSKDIANKLSKVLGTSAEYWISIQREYDGFMDGLDETLRRAAGKDKRHD